MDVAMQMLWLGSTDASFVTGEVVVMDGGMGISNPAYEDYIQV